MSKGRTFFLLWVFAALSVLGLYAVALWFGALNQDEGWYLYAGRLVSEGQIPFVDFASTQGPIMAYVYALAQPLVRLFGVAGGRLFTAVLGFTTLLCSARLAYLIVRFRGRDNNVGGIDRVAVLAALLVFSLLGMNLYNVYFTTIVKTYSLAGLFVIAGFMALERGLRSGGGGNTTERTKTQSTGDQPTKEWTIIGFSFLSGGMFALAAGVRLSAGILLPVIWLMLALFWLRGGRRRSDFAAVVGFLVGGSVVLLSIYVPLLIMAPKAVGFGLFGYHSGREVGSAAVVFAYKGGFVMRLVGSYFTLAVAAAVGIWSWFTGVGNRLDGGAKSRPSRIIPVMSAGFAAVTFIHLTALFPYDDYQVFIMPVLAVTVAVAVAPLLLRVRYGTVIVMLLLLAYSVSSPMLQSWLLAERDRIWWPLRSETPLQRLKLAAELVKESCGLNETGCDTLLTQDTYLAVEAGMHVPQGMELGPFCYFPGMEKDMADTCHVLNWETFREVLLSGSSPVAAFSGYGLAIRSPQVSQLSKAEQDELWRVVELSYKPFATVDAFGQADTTLRILKCLEKK